jgi:hypothetical protein
LKKTALIPPMCLPSSVSQRPGSAAFTIRRLFNRSERARTNKMLSTKDGKRQIGRVRRKEDEHLDSGYRRPFITLYTICKYMLSSVQNSIATHSSVQYSLLPRSCKGDWLLST